MVIALISGCTKDKKLKDMIEDELGPSCQSVRVSVICATRGKKYY